jgi:hypothetical protein
MAPLLLPVPGACLAARVGEFMDGFLDAQNCRQLPGQAGDFLLAVVFA